MMHPLGLLARRWRVLVAAAATLALLGLLLAPRPVSVETARLVRGPIAESVADQGVMRVREAYTVAAPVAGKLERLRFKVGDRVDAGDVLARIRPMSSEFLDPRSQAQARAAVAAAQASSAAAQAEVRSATARRDLAERDLARTKTLADRGIASSQALETALMAARTARSAEQSALAHARARAADLALARAALVAPTTASDGATPLDVTAPARGLVTRVFQESERPLPAGAPILEIGDRGGLEAAIEMLSQDAVRIREGQPAELYDWGGPPLQARVRRVEPQAFTKVSALGVEEQRVLVLLQLVDTPDHWASLGAGYRVWGRVILHDSQDAVLAPIGALVRNGRDWAVFVADGSRAQLTPVQIGAMDERNVEIRAGLPAGSEVVVFPSDKVRDGVRIRRRAPDAA